MRGRPGCLLQSAGGEANRILMAWEMVVHERHVHDDVLYKFTSAVLITVFVNLYSSKYHCL